MWGGGRSTSMGRGGVGCAPSTIEKVYAGPSNSMGERKKESYMPNLPTISPHPGVGWGSPSPLPFFPTHPGCLSVSALLVEVGWG